MMPPPKSCAVPVMVTRCPSTKLAPMIGELIDEVGFNASVDWVARIRLASSVVGWMPMSANMLTIACCTLGSVGVSGP